MHDPQISIQHRALGLIPRQAMGGLSLLLVVALTFGAARTGAIVQDAGSDARFERAAAILPRVVHQAQRRLQRERPDARSAIAARRDPAARRARVVAVVTGEAARPSMLRAGLIDLPPPPLA